MKEISVMICDDSALMRNLIGRIVDEAEGLVLAGKAMNGKFLLDKIPRIKPDIILLDLEMPEMNGIEFLKETYMPAFLNVEYRLRDSHSTPYVFLQTGYQVAIEESRTVYYDVYPAWSSVWPGPDYGQENLNAKGGILINPGIGYLQMFSPNFGMSFAFAYRFHKLHYAGEKDYGLDIDYNRLAVKIGIIFN